MKRKIAKLLLKINTKFGLSTLYWIVLKRKCNFKEPKDLNEKVQWMNLNENNDLKVKCSDKYEVKKHLEMKGYKEYIPKLYEIYNDVSEINFDLLPNKFVLKCTHGCKYNIICKDEDSLDKKVTCEKLNLWMKEDYSKVGGELHYSKIKPRIICEEYIESIDLGFPYDYKIHCFNGIPSFILVCSERETKTKLSVYDLKWNRYTNALTKKYDNNKEIQCPRSLNKMIEIATSIAKEFNLVRIDFYDVEGRPMIGELTFTPGAGRIDYFTKEFLLEKGKELNI